MGEEKSHPSTTTGASKPCVLCHEATQALGAVHVHAFDNRSRVCG